MGQIPKLASTVLCMLLILPLTSCSSTKAPSSNQESIIVYLHDYSGRRNATVVPVVGISGKPWVFSSFGTLFAVDDPVTAAPSAGSRVIGRAQGILVINSLDGSSMQMLLSIVFSDGVGSTLQIQGTTRQSDRVREVSIVSGTKYYRFARGYAVLETLIYDPETSYAMVLCNITLLPT
ncbi:unnamed protein product [Rhodiola kirilowii]